MKVNNKYTSLFGKVATQLVATYEEVAEVNLRDANEQFIENDVTCRFMLRILVMTCLVAVIMPTITLGILLYYSEISSGYLLLIQATTSALALALIAYLAWARYLKAFDVRVEAERILDSFEKVVEDLNPISCRGYSFGVKPEFVLNRYLIHTNLILMAKKIRDCEDHVEYVREHSNGDVRDLESVWNSVNEAKEQLDKALGHLHLFKLSFTKKQLFEEASKKVNVAAQG